MEKIRAATTWVKGVWPMAKEIICQKIHTYHLPSSPTLLLLDLINNHLLDGLTIIITGATSGIGLHTARELVMAGAHVIMACRNTKAANEIVDMWKQEAQNSKILNVEVMELDLLSLTSVRRFAEEWMRRDEPLHILINNAGILRMGEPKNFSNDGFEQHIQVNHIAPALLTLLLLPWLQRASSSRIINVNSVAHHCGTVELENWNSKIDEQHFSGLKAYGASKLVHLMFLKALANKLLDQISNKGSIQCIAVHPGIVSTNLAPGMGKNFWMFDPAQGARSVIFCATSTDIKENLVKGFAYYSCNCKPGRISSQAGNMDACFEVWKKTMEILGLETDYLIHLLDN